jgi:N-acetylglucosamine-6-phosphate deacetylase
MADKGIILKNGILLTPFISLYDKVLFLKNGKIEKIISTEELSFYRKERLSDYKIIDVNNHYISPGFIDLHIHGANNIDAVQGPYGPMSGFLIKYGTTGFLPTFWNADINTLIEASGKISRFIRTSYSGAKILGINSEGPYLNPKYGAQVAERALIPEFKDYSRLIKACAGNLKLMTVSPEVKGSAELIRYLRSNDVKVAINYTDIGITELKDAINIGINHIDHIFDGFGVPAQVEKGVRPRDLQEELLVCDSLMAEVIADRNGIHVHPTLLKILVRCKGVQNVILITDSRDIAGNPPGKYLMNDGYFALIRDKEDVVRLENGGLAGCIMTMNEAIRNMRMHTGIGLADAVRMATYNPAKAINISNRKGQIKAGMDADIVVFDRNINISLAIIDGEIEYEKR